MAGTVAALAVCLTATATAPLNAQEPSATVGTLIVAHGGGPAWDGQVAEVAALVETGGPVEISFLMGSGAPDHRFQDAARNLVERGADEIVVVPLLVSSHSSHYNQIRHLAGQSVDLDESMLHHLHMSGIEPADVDVPIRLAPALDGAAQIADVLAARAREMTGAPGQSALFLMGHGPNGAEAHAEWMRNLRVVAERVEALTGFADVKVGLVRDDAPPPVREEAVRSIREVIELQHRLTGRDVIVVPVLIAAGSVSREKFPVDLAGLPVIYDGDALLPHPGMARYIEARVREARAR